MNGLKICSEAYTIEGDYIFFYDYRYGCVYWLEDNFLSNKISECRELGVGINDRLFGNICNTRDKFILIPLLADRIIALSKKTTAIESIQLDMDRAFNFSGYKCGNFLSAHYYNGSVFMMPTSYPGIVEYEIESGHVYYYDDWIDTVLDINGRHDEVAFFRETMIMDGIIYAPLCKADYLFKFNLNSKKWEVVRIDGDERGYSAICYDGDNYWLAPRIGDKITIWDQIQSKQICGIWKNNTRFSQILFFDNTIWVFPYNEGCIGVYTGDRFEVFQGYSLEGTFSAKISKGVLYIVSVFSGELIKVFSKDKYFIKRVYFDENLSNRYHFYYSKIYRAINDNQYDLCQKETCDNRLNDLLRALSVKEICK